MRKLLLLLCLLVVVEPARAEMRAGELLAAYPTEERAKTYLDGLATGISWYAAAVDARQHHRAHCPPDNLAITTDQYASILRRRVQAHPDELRDSAGYVLIKALAETFPCR